MRPVFHISEEQIRAIRSFTSGHPLGEYLTQHYKKLAEQKKPKPQPEPPKRRPIGFQHKY